ncbi:MAG: alpha/beta hydrolase-fold protein [Firmicutes bacterium]|nr:alpha/beta hydrolase-fold protein [Bacillota bacterium]
MVDGPAHSGIGRKIEGHSLYSAHLGEERTMKIFVPPGYDASVRYPILYAHDGDEFFTHGRIATLAQQLIVSGQIRPLLIAGIAVDRTWRTEDYAFSGTRNRAFIQFVIEECMPHVERLYSVESADRAMAGISLGASLTVQIALSHPDLFRSMLLYSGAFGREIQSAVRSDTAMDSLHAWIVVGTSEDRAVTPRGIWDILDANRQMHERLSAAGARVQYAEVPGQHLWGFWQSQTPAALAWLNERWAGAF